MGNNIAEVISERGLEALGRFYSKYRAVVVENIDPKGMNRLAVTVPQIGMNTATWAYPCINEGSTKSGFKWLTPKKGAIVYVEFQLGDTQYPLWSYHSWALGEIPPGLDGLEKLGFVTPNGNLFTLDDSNGELCIELKDPDDEATTITQIVMSKELVKVDTSSEVEINAPKITYMNGTVGTTLTDKLLEKINKLEDEINNLKDIMVAAASPTSLLVAEKLWGAVKIAVTELNDIENKKILQ